MDSLFNRLRQWWADFDKPIALSTVQTVTCDRLGKVLWTKKVHIVSNELAQFYSKYQFQFRDGLCFDVVGPIELVTKKPRSVIDWKDLQEYSLTLKE